MSKAMLKRLIGGVVTASGVERLRDRSWQANHQHPLVVLCFHRVTDAIPEDPITISKARFRAIIAAIARDYRPMAYDPLVDCLMSGAPWPRRAVAITFDDGYLDNYTTAAPILREHGVPATFFVAANLVGSDTVLPWEQHLAGQVPWMTWDHVRELDRHGFKIGAHTLSHCDLGRVQGAEAEREIRESKSKIERELGTPVRHFAFPFGSLKNINEANMELIRAAGYDSCCSAYGGIIRSAVDRYRIPRLPVNHWYKNLYELEFEMRILAPWKWQYRPVTF
jgi:peptidoglycan/xylan/chitin deacetylase (PgdA/CDA1 family)